MRETKYFAVRLPWPFAWNMWLVGNGMFLVKKFCADIAKTKSDIV